MNVTTLAIGQRPLTDADAVEARTGLKRWRIYELVRQGILPAVHCGRRIKFDPDRIEEWIREGGRPLG